MCTMMLKTIKSINPIKKDLDYTLLDKIYTPIDIYNLDFDSDIHLLKDVDIGAKLLIETIKKKGHICIVSDSDCDGITSAVVLTKGIKKILGSKTITTIVNEYKNGNGFNEKLNKKIISLHRDHPIDLIITSDHGSNDNESFRYIKEKCTGVKIILTDHHTIHTYPTEVDVFINPMREDSTYSKSISGCCTAFLLIIKSMIIKGIDLKKCYELVPYVGISTIVDCMDMNIPYNQFLVEMSLRIMNSGRYLYWEIFKIKLGTGICFRSKDFGFTLGPIINCGKVLNIEEHMFKLLIEEDIDKVSELLLQAIEYNKKRKEITKEYSKLVSDRITGKENTICEIIDVKRDLVLNGKVASQVGSKYNLPTVIFTNGNEVLNGSGRSIVANYNILEVMYKIKDTDDKIFNTLGGHYGALGCSIFKDKYNIFKELFNSYTKEVLVTDIPMHVDLYVHHNYINTKLLEEQSRYGNFGTNRETPTYFTIMTIDRVNDYGSICKLKLKQNNHSILASYFFSDISLTKDNLNDIKNKLCFIAFSLGLKAFRGSYTLDMIVKRVEVIK